MRHVSDGLIFDYTSSSSVSDWLITGISISLVDGGLCSVVDPDPYWEGVAGSRSKGIDQN